MAEEKPRKIKASGLPRLTMPEQNPKRRATNFEEVPYEELLKQKEELCQAPA